MEVPVYMTAYGTKNEIRIVEIPDNEITPKSTISDALALTFKYGQNDFQPRQHPSVSVGDVVYLKNRYFMVLGVGWKELTEVEFKGLPDNVARSPKFLNKMYGV